MKRALLILIISTSFALEASQDYCIDQYNRTQESMHKVIVNNKADREYYAKIEANMFQDRLINLRLNCSKTKDKTIRRFLKDSKKMEESMVTLELLKHTSY